MRINVCIATMIPELAYDAANLAIDNATGPVHVMIGANMCQIDEARIHPCASVDVESYADNEGVVPPMHNMWRRRLAAGGGDGRDDVMVYIHDDCQILERGWDARLINIMTTQESCDCVGLVGGTGMGSADIYKAPYQISHLVRHGVHSALVDAEVHGRRASGPMLLATADGCALFVRRSFLDEIGGWSWWPEVNHGYDNALACMLRRHGRQLWLLPVRFVHPSLLKQQIRSQADVAMARYYERFGEERFGDANSYTRAHRALYETFRDVLPFQVD